jgi:hypothetical protein
MIRCALCIAVLLGTVSPAFAQGGLREKLEKMSGPKFEGWEFRLPVTCTWTANGKPRRTALYFNARKTVEYLDQGYDRLLCFDVAFASFNNADRDAVGALVNFQRWESAATFRFDRFDRLNREKLGWLTVFEPGIALGAVTFLNDQHRESRFEASLRATVKPLKAVPAWRTKSWSSVVVIAVREQWTTSITNTDIGVAAYDPFRHGWLFGWGIGLYGPEPVR